MLKGIFQNKCNKIACEKQVIASLKSGLFGLGGF